MIRKKSPERDIVIDLTGPEGNAYVLLGVAKKMAERLDMDPQPILKEMREGDYENLVQTLEKYFGDYLILER